VLQLIIKQVSHKQGDYTDVTHHQFAARAPEAEEFLSRPPRFAKREVVGARVISSDTEILAEAAPTVGLDKPHPDTTRLREFIRFIKERISDDSETSTDTLARIAEKIREIEPEIGRLIE
jgi:hypothetical protein